MNIYQTITQWIQHNRELHSSEALKTTLLSLHHGHPVSLWEVFSVLDQERTGWALQAITRFAKEGESPELNQAARALLELNDAT